MLGQLDGCVSFVVVFKFSEIAVQFLIPLRVTNEFFFCLICSLLLVHVLLALVTSLYLCLSEGRVTVRFVCITGMINYDFIGSSLLDLFRT